MSAHIQRTKESPMVKHITSAVEKIIPIIVGSSEKPKRAEGHDYLILLKMRVDNVNNQIYHPVILVNIYTKHE